MSKKLFIFSLAFLLIFPLAVLAINFPPQPGNNLSIIGSINAVISALWYIFIGISVIMFIVAGYFFVSSNGDPGKVKLAKGALLWGIIGVGVALLSTSIPFILSDIFS